MEYFQAPLNKIACSAYNAAAISDKGELYLWGSVKSGIFGLERTKAQVFYKLILID